jgi:hypothetical protein
LLCDSRGVLDPVAKVGHRFWDADIAIFANCILEVGHGDVEKNKGGWVRDESGVAEVDGCGVAILRGVVGEICGLPERECICILVNRISR